MEYFNKKPVTIRVAGTTYKFKEGDLLPQKALERLPESILNKYFKSNENERKKAKKSKVQD